VREDKILITELVTLSVRDRIDGYAGLKSLLTSLC